MEETGSPLNVMFQLCFNKVEVDSVKWGKLRHFITISSEDMNVYFLIQTIACKALTVTPRMSSEWVTEWL